MPSGKARAISIKISDTQRVSGLLQVPHGAWACWVMAHGAGAGMRHPFLAAMADALAARGVATLRYQFPYMERGSKRPDAPAVAHAAVRSAVTTAARRVPKLPLFAGGKSFGARMTSQAQAAAPLPGVRGLVFLGFPLHPAGAPATTRAQHLADVAVPMLFLQGTRDDLAELRLLKPLVRKLGPRATLALYPDADHSFHVRARSAQNDAEVRAQMAAAIVAWMRNHAGASTPTLVTSAAAKPRRRAPR